MKSSFSTINDFNITDNNNVYAYFPNPPLEVQEGDILGVFQPTENESPLAIYYQDSSGPFNYGNPSSGMNVVDDPYTSFTIDSALNVNDYSLVSVILGKFE